MLIDNSGNLPPHANPCCGHITDASSEISRMDKFELPDVGDIAICINCGAILVYSDPKQNVTRYASRVEIETLPRETKHKLSVAQTFIRKRGWIPRDAARRDGN
jgi:hypothetical protein